MDDLDLDSSASDWAIDYPRAVAVFQQLGIDYTCGGRSLRYVCRQSGLDSQAVLAQLQDLHDD